MFHRRSLASSLTALLLASSVFAQVDWRASQSPIKNQGHRGTCAAFAICGALETFPGIPGDLSEQLLFATLKLHQNAVANWMTKAGTPTELGEGDLFDAYIKLFEHIGTCPEVFLPYDPDPKRAAPSVPDELKRYLELAHVSPAELERIRDGFGKYGFAESDCTIFDAVAAKDPEPFKRLLDSGVVAIPVGYAVHAPSWTNLKDVGNMGADGKRLFVHPGMMEMFARPDGEGRTYNQAKGECMKTGEDFVESVRSGKWLVRPIGNEKEYGGHAVLLVGYDERGFIAKNSWGTDWGDGGYFRVAWDYHRLYAINGLVLGAARIRNPALSPFETTARIQKGRFHVKVQTRGTGESERWVLSTWMEEPRDAGHERVEYRVEGLGADGEWRLLARSVVAEGDDRSRNGAPWVLRGPALTAVHASSSVRVGLKVGMRAMLRPDDIEDVRWIREVEFAAFDPDLKVALDLVPKP